MPEVNVFAMKSFREVIRAVYALGGTLALTQEEVAAHSGFSGSHLSNARGRTRKLSFDHGVRLARAMWLDMESARFFATRVRLATCGPRERDGLREQLASLEEARRRAVAEGRLFARAPSLPPPLELYTSVVPLLFHGTRLALDPAAIAAALRPTISHARAAHLLGLTRGLCLAPPRLFHLLPPDDPFGRLAHVAAVRRLYYPLFNVPSAEGRVRLSVWAMSREDMRYLGGQIADRLRRLVERLGEGDPGGEPRVVMQVVGRLFQVTESAGAETGGAGVARPDKPRVLPSSDSPPGPRLMAYWELSPYLRARFAQRKEENANRSYGSFGRMVGLSASAVGNIVTGYRPLTEEHAAPFGAALGHKGDELAYFCLVAELDRTTCPVRLTTIRAEMARLRLKHGYTPKEQDQLIFFARWYYAVIREMALWPSFRADAAWVAARLRPRISVEEAKEALKAMVQLKILEEDGEGRLRPTGPLVTLPEALRSDTETYLFHHVADLAEHALLTCPPDELHADGYCVSVPLSRVQEVMDGLDEIQEAVIAWLRQRPEQAPADRVGVLFLDAVPLSREIK